MTDTEIAPVLESTNAPTVVETPVAAPEPVEKSASLDDTLAATMAKIVADRPKQGDDGKFIPKAGAITATPKVEVPGSTQAAPPDPQKPVIEAPQSLPADVKAKWDALPPETQQWLATRESEVHKKFTTDGERLKTLDAFEAALSESRDFLEQNQIPKPEYARRLAMADNMLRANGPAGLRQIAEMYRINPADAFGGGQPQQGQPLDPRISALSQELAQVKSHLTAQEQAQQAARLEDAGKKIDTFKVSHPHFDRVEPLMVKLYEPGMELDQLYTMAVNAHPEVSKEVQAEAAKAAEAKALEEAKKKAADAAKLAPFARKPGSVAASTKPGSNWEDTMKAKHQELKRAG